MILNARTPLAGGRYIVQRHLDSGAMADVYLATDTQRAVNVALKVLRSDLSLDEYFEEYFRREAAVLQQLQHPNIVRLYELERDSNLLFLVMDYIEGPTLQQHLFEKKLLQTAYVLKIGQALAAALDYAHKKGVIHRDIKPSNVLLANSGVILLNDFGVARVAGNTTSAGASGPVGTLAYMAPEQIGGADITGAADQYALAVVIWELLSGRRPFTGKASRLTASPLPERIIDEHLHHQPPADVLPPALTSALSRALAKDPRQRFPTCAAFMQVLQTAATKEMPTVALAPAAKTEDKPVTSQILQPAAQNPSTAQITRRRRPALDVDISKTTKPALEPAATVKPAAGPEARSDAFNQDPLIALAIELVKKHRKASISFLHRELELGNIKLGYTRAARLLDKLEEMGIVGPEKFFGTTRDVLLHDDETFTTPKPAQTIRDVIIAALRHPAVTAIVHWVGWTSLQIGVLLILLLILLIITVVATPQLFQSAILSFVSAVLTAAIFLLVLLSGSLFFKKKWKPGALAFIAFIAVSSAGARVTRQIEPNQALQIEIAALATQAAAPTVATAPTDVPTSSKTFLDGGKYIGELSNGRANGQGTVTWLNGNKYTGDFKDDMANGQGTKTWPNGETYTGQFKDRKRFGQGTLTYANGDTYTGEWEEDLRAGEGTLTTRSGVTYTGDWQYGTRFGQGIQTEANGDTYIGKWALNTRNGQGTSTFADGSKYTGEFKDDKPNGLGTETDSSGKTIYVGQFQNGDHVVPTATQQPKATNPPSATAPPAATKPPAATALPAPTQPPAATALPTETAAPPPTALPTTPPITLSMENARRKAESYLRVMEFSRTGLIEQLKYGGFPEADAIYGVDALNVDWNAQAAKKAASYLKVMPFSRSGLIDQLIYTGFTPEQAEYGVSTTGL